MFNFFTVNVQLGYGDSWAEKTESQYSQPLILYKYKMEQYQLTILVHVLFESVCNLIIKLHELNVQQSMLSCINAGESLLGIILKLKEIVLKFNS